MYVLLNGAFGIGKSSVAVELQRRLADATTVNPERIGVVLQHLPGYHRSDFQHLRAWRRLTVAWGRMMGRWRSTVIMPMAFSEVAYLDEVRSGLAAGGGRVLHYCLTAPLDVVQGRLAARGEPAADRRWAWVHRRAAECCEAHQRAEFAVHVPTVGRSAATIAEDVAHQVLAVT